MTREEEMEIMPPTQKEIEVAYNIIAFLYDTSIDNVKRVMELSKSFPPAEGAEEILEKHMKLSSIQPINGGYPLHVVKIAMQEFATLHAQRLAEMMVEEKMREDNYGRKNYSKK